MIQRGKFIVVEGADGSGKTTTAFMLKEKLIAKGLIVQTVNILKDDPVSAQLRAILTNPDSVIHPDAEACLYAAAVTNVYHQTILPLLEKGVNVVADRNQISTWAYQVIPQALLGNRRPEHIFKAAYGEITSDLIIMLFADSKTGLGRCQARDGKLDRLELRGVDYQDQVQHGYRHYCDSVLTQQNVHTYQNNGTMEELDEFLDSVLLQMDC